MILLAIHNACKDYIAPNAMHDTNEADGRLKCHPGTRVYLLNKLSDFAQAVESPIHVIWLHGSAGYGKSAICRSLAKQLEESKTLAGSFFFFKTDPRRNSAKALIATLVYQIAYYAPEIRQYIANAITDDPTIYRKSLKTQWVKLILEPVTQLAAGDPLQGRSSIQKKLILIDGLDECEDRDDRRDLFDAIRSCLDGPFKLLITSRPEHDIRESFNTLSPIECIDLMHLPSFHDDIKLYLRDSFAQIKRTHTRKDFAPSWPPEDLIKQLASKASGQFIYAQTVVKYIEDTSFDPEKRLNIILDSQTTPQDHNPYAELDSLYCKILTSSKTDRKTLIRVLMIQLAFRRLLLQSRLTDAFHLYFLMQSDAFTGSILGLSPQDVELAFVDLNSLIAPKVETITGPDCCPRRVKVTVMELATSTSFIDFFFDPSRSGEFHGDFGEACTELCKGCVNVLNDENFSAKE